MSTNFYFNNFPSSQITQEQLLVEDLVIEAMQIHGMDVWYLPRSSDDQVDMLFGDDPTKSYRKAYSIEMYLENVSGMDGDQDFISKFGLEVRDELTMLVSRRRFKYTTGGSGLVRPREGDLIYIPLLKNFFEISFVEHENNQAMFYTLGRGRGGNVYVYAIKLKQFVFSEEVVQTGIAEIDDTIRDYYKPEKVTMSLGGTGNYEVDEVVYQGSSIEYATARAVVYSWTPTPPTLNLIRLKGTFANNTIIRGNTSSALWTASSIPDPTSFEDNAFEDIVDNNRIEGESDSILDFTESNPFGEA